MAKEILPAIGAAGQWKLKPPFDTQLIPGVAYSCKAIRKLSEVVATGIDAKAEYYDANSIPEATYEQHVIDDISIVTLLSSEGNWLFVPGPYLDGWPSSDVVPYVVLGLFANLGAIPNTLDPEFLKEKVKNVIKANIGNTPEMDLVTLSEVTNKSWATHQALEVTRKLQITDSNTDFVRRVRAENALIAAQAQIAALQQFIIDSGLIIPTP